MPNGLPKVYLDTNIFQPLIYDSDTLSDEQFAQRQLEDLRGDVRSDEIEVVIPKPAIGEVVNNYYEDLAEFGEAEVGTWEDFSGDLSRYLEQVDATLCGINQGAVSTAKELVDTDTRLAGTDAVIAACALEDEWSNHLVTEDPDFHETEAIQAVDQDRQPTPRLFSLNITDNY